MNIYERRQRAGYRQWPTTPGEPDTPARDRDIRIYSDATGRPNSKETGRLSEAERLAHRLPTIQLEVGTFQLL